MNRRAMLRLVGAVAVGSLAGCGDGQTDVDASPTTGTPTTGIASPTPTADATDTPAGTAPPTETATATPGSTPQDAAQVITVGESGFRFDPDSFEIAADETVVWIWRGSNHNVVPDDIPEDSTWSGTEGGPSRTYENGHELRFTFETPGSYTYYCAPHRDVGMTGSFTVVE